MYKMRKGGPYMTSIYKDLWTDIERHYNYKYPSTREFIMDVAHRFQANLLIPYAPHDEADWSGALHAIGSLGLWLEDLQPDATPETYLEMVGYGHFKETYKCGPHFVLKLCSRRNPTAEEEELLNDAYNEEVEDYFVPTIFFSLPVYRDPAILEPGDSDDDLVYNHDDHVWEPNPDVEPDNTLVALEFQLVVDPYAEPDSREAGPEFAARDIENPLYIKYPDLEPMMFLPLDGACQKFVEDFAAIYGLNALVRLADFCADHHVSDLHDANTGTLCLYPGDLPRPIILDWLSR